MHCFPLDMTENTFPVYGVIHLTVVNNTDLQFQKRLPRGNISNLQSVQFKNHNEIVFGTIL